MPFFIKPIFHLFVQMPTALSPHRDLKWIINMDRPGSKSAFHWIGSDLDRIEIQGFQTWIGSDRDPVLSKWIGSDRYPKKSDRTPSLVLYDESNVRDEKIRSDWCRIYFLVLRKALAWLIDCNMLSYTYTIWLDLGLLSYIIIFLS